MIVLEILTFQRAKEITLLSIVPLFLVDRFAYRVSASIFLKLKRSLFSGSRESAAERCYIIEDRDS